MHPGFGRVGPRYSLEKDCPLVSVREVRRGRRTPASVVRVMVEDGRADEGDATGLLVESTYVNLTRGGCPPNKS